MANDLDIQEAQEEQAEAARPRRVQGNPIDNVGPTCMFWCMVIGLSLFLGVMLVWGLSHIGSITGS